MKTTLDIQRRLLSLGYQLPKFGADGLPGDETAAALRQFQQAKGFPATGTVTDETLAALFHQPAGTVSPLAVSSSWMPRAAMQRIVVHWTAGAHKASSLDREHYHILIEADGTLVRGVPTIDLNAAPAKKGYAAHTLRCNTGSIGVSLCCMAGAVEQPFNAGQSPMTKEQWDKLPHVLAALCERYSIEPTSKTVLSHAEVQGTLGIKQRGKWDISRLAFNPSIIGARACGDEFRRATASLLN
jgi:hypothetical protein